MWIKTRSEANQIWLESYRSISWISKKDVNNCVVRTYRHVHRNCLLLWNLEPTWWVAAKYKVTSFCPWSQFNSNGAISYQSTWCVRSSSSVHVASIISYESVDAKSFTCFKAWMIPATPPINPAREIMRVNRLRAWRSQYFLRDTFTCRMYISIG